MSNMPYCRFQNTYRDLEDCRAQLQEMTEGADEYGEPTEPLSASELNYAQLLLACVTEIAGMLIEAGHDLIEPSSEKVAAWLEEVNVRLVEETRQHREER